MRTTLDLPDGLVEEAREVIGFKSKTDTVVFALKEVIRRSQVQDLKKLITTFDYEFDPTQIRKKERASAVIVVDTSVWIAARRQPNVDRVLQELLDADEVAVALPVRLELWAGVARQDRKAHRAAFSALPQLVPTEETWQPLTEWIAQSSRRRRTVHDDRPLDRVAAVEIGGLVWSLDKDFERMERLKIVSLYALPH